MDMGRTPNTIELESLTVRYGSPTLFVRAMRVLTEGVSDSATASVLLRCAGRVTSEAYELTELDFLPHNHSDHHHIQYAVASYGEMYGRP